MKEYVCNLSTNFSDMWQVDVEVNIDDVYFVWINNLVTALTVTPEFNIEDSTRGNVGIITKYNHLKNEVIMIFFKIINGNGMKTLYEHYTMADHHSNSVMNFDYTVKGIHKIRCNSSGKLKLPKDFVNTSV